MTVTLAALLVLAVTAVVLLALDRGRLRQDRRDAYFRGWDDAKQHWQPSISSPVANWSYAGPDQSFFITTDDEVPGSYYIVPPEERTAP